MQNVALNAATCYRKAEACALFVTGMKTLTGTVFFSS